VMSLLPVCQGAGADGTQPSSLTMSTGAMSVGATAPALMTRNRYEAWATRGISAGPLPFGVQVARPMRSTFLALAMASLRLALEMSPLIAGTPPWPSASTLTAYTDSHALMAVGRLRPGSVEPAASMSALKALMPSLLVSL